MIFTFVITLFVAFAVSRVIIRFKSKDFGLSEFLFWMLIWIGIEVVIWIPKVLDEVARTIGIGRGIDAVVYASIVLLFYLVYRIYAKLKGIQRDTTELVRKIALEKSSMPSTDQSVHIS